MSYTFDFEGLHPYWDRFAERGTGPTIQLSVAAEIAYFASGPDCAVRRRRCLEAGSTCLSTSPR